MAHVKSLTTLLAVLIASTAMGACLDVGGSLDAPEPVWFSGYVFSYTDGGRFTVKSSGEGPDGGGSRNQEETFGPTNIVYEVVNTTLQGAAKEPAYLVAFARSDASKEKQDESVRVDAGGGNSVEVPMPRQNIVLGAVRQRDLADLPVSWSLDESCVNRVCRLVLERVLIGAGPQWTMLDFPLKSGKEWTATMQDDIDDFDGVRMRMQAEVDGKAKAKTPLGSLNAIRVSFDFKPENLEDVKDEIRRDAESEGVRIKSLDLSLRMHMDVFYSPVYQNVVRVERQFDQSFKISGSEEGEDFSFAFENHVEYVRELTGARLVAYPERDLSGIGRILLGDSPMGDPSGEAFKPVGYSVHINTNHTKVNVAQKETASFGLGLKGVRALPTDHTASWSVIDPFGEKTQKGSGALLQFTPESPGLYLIELETRDGNGNVTSAAVQPLAANFIATQKAACAQAVLAPALAQGCDSMSVPVRPGIRSLKATATIGGPFVQFGQGELRLTDASGHVTRDTTRTSNSYSITMGGDVAFNLRGIGARDWTLAYVPQRAVQETAEYAVELLYGEDTMPEMPVKSADELVAAMHESFLLQTGRSGPGAGLGLVA